MKTNNHPWSRLVLAARSAPAPLEDQAPFGFATRVSSQAFAQERPSAFAVLERLSIRGLAVAGVLAMLALAANYSLLTHRGEEDVGAALADPVTEMLGAIHT